MLTRKLRLDHCRFKMSDNIISTKVFITCDFTPLLYFIKSSILQSLRNNFYWLGDDKHTCTCQHNTVTTPNKCFYFFLLQKAATNGPPINDMSLLVQTEFCWKIFLHIHFQQHRVITHISIPQRFFPHLNEKWPITGLAHIITVCFIHMI